MFGFILKLKLIIALPVMLAIVFSATVASICCIAVLRNNRRERQLTSSSRHTFKSLGHPPEVPGASNTAGTSSVMREEVTERSTLLTDDSEEDILA